MNMPRMQPSGPYKFWSDDFDMDLLKVFPETVSIIGTLAEAKLWTVGSDTHGRLNHPTVWNSHGAFVWITPPQFSRDKDGWFNAKGCVSDSRVIECTWLELLRDQWPHGYSFLLIPEELRFPGPRRDFFEEIMYDLRGWRRQDVSRQRAWVIQWITDANRRLDRMLSRQLASSTQDRG
jgi:hypothetical protein